ncbi:MAG TPA: hypothetical protein PKG52_10100 [bacterium]|nr:hypothetical protein [bacterium]HPS31157.1 hypothetical protein [bacterium]
MARIFSFLFVLAVFVFSVSCGDSTVRTHKSDNDLGVSDDDSELSDSTTDENSDETADEQADSDNIPETCGNSAVDVGEICDGNVINCTEIDPLKYESGKAKCLATCLGWNTATCVEIPQTCGNSEVEGAEVCDGNLKNCTEIDAEKYMSGKASCLDDCTGFDVATCEEYTNECGNEIVEIPEVCDGGLKNCTEIDADLYKGGKAYCKDDCKGWDTITCEEIIPCTETIRAVDCVSDSSLDQVQTCFEGEWTDQGECLKPGEYALLEKDAAAMPLPVDLTSTPEGTDVLLIFDTSGSMTSSMDVLKNSISTITANIRTYIPDSDFAVVTLGTLGYSPFTALQNVTDDLTAITTKVGTLTYGNGSEEYHTLTIEQSASGAGTNQSIRTTAGGTVYNTTVPAATCGTGLRGGVCFRENSLPAFILMSDEVFNTTGWIWDTGAETTIDDVAESMNAINAKIAVIDSSGDSKVLSGNAATLASKTNSYDLSGAEHYFSVPTTGAELNLKIEEAAKAIYDSTKMDVGIELESVEDNIIESTQFVKSYATVSATPADSIDSKDTSKFYGALRETVLRYSLSLQNTTTVPGEVKFIKLRIKAKWNAMTLDSKEVTLVIP